MKSLLTIVLLIVLAACSGTQAASTPTAPAASNAALADTVATEEIVEAVTETEESIPTEETDATEEAAAVPVEASTPAELCAAAVPAQDPASREYSQPEQVLQPGTDYRAVFCTDAGPIYIDLFEDFSPVTVNNFVFLAKNGYYNNTIFHRVIADFMAQGGDPTATGSGGPGYQFKDEFVGFLKFDRPGLLAMANANRPEQGIVGTNGSQFFITTVPTPHLDYRHTIFGEVLEGQENVLNIQIRDPQQADSPATALQTVLIITNPETVEAVVSDETAEAGVDEVVQVFEALKSSLASEAGLEITNSAEPLTVETAAETAPENLREDYAAFLQSHDYEYGYSSLIDNTGCNLDSFAFMTLGYRLDAFTTPEAASAALADGFLDQLATAEGFEKTDTQVMGGTLYSKPLQACSMGATAGRVFAQRGRFIATFEATIPTDRPFGLAEVLEQLVGLRLYELALADVLRQEVR
jgi:cyclophilin family peptidyl-prolyl cis-trans isomerase